MFDPHQLLIFGLASLTLAVTPGPVVLYVIARSISQGKLAGAISVLGAATGTLIHIGATALGLSALLLSSALAFQLVKYLGAAYLIYLGVRQWRTAPETRVAEANLPLRSLKKIFVQGFVVNALNPKAVLFFLAFLPQFIDPAKGSAIAQLFVLGCIFLLVASSSDMTYALIAGTLGDWLRHNRRFWNFQRYFTGTAYIGLGLVTADLHSD